MSTEKFLKELTVRITESNFNTLRILSEKLDMSISEVVRAIIPKIPHSQPLKQMQQKKISLQILEKYDQTRLSKILDEMISKRKAKMLAQEIKEQLIDCEHKRDNLTKTTEKRLLRWAHPARIDDRTEFASPKAKEICKILFGFVPERND